MSRRYLVVVGLALAAALTSAAPVQAGVVWGAELFGGWSSYAMSDFNDSLASANQSLGTNFADIKGGGAGGFGVRMWPTEQILLRLDFEGLLAQTEDSGVTFDIGPGAATLSGTYFFPSQSPVRFGLGAGLGTYSIAGELKGPGGKFNTAGSGFGFHGMGEAVLPFSGRWSLSGILGYRYAKVDDVKVNDQSTNTEADFSGVMVRVGLAYDWKPKH